MTGTNATVGGIVAAVTINQWGDFPGAVASASSAASQSIVSGPTTYANLPTTSVTASLVTTHANTLVHFIWSGEFGSGAIGTPTNTGFLSVALSGSITMAASDTNAIAGSSPGVTSAACYSMFAVVPAGTVTATLQAHYGISSGFSMRSFNLQIAAIRIV